MDHEDQFFVKDGTIYFRGEGGLVGILNQGVDLESSGLTDRFLKLVCSILNFSPGAAIVAKEVDSALDPEEEGLQGELFNDDE